MKTTLGGPRLGSGNKQQVDLRTFNRSSHNLSYIWKSSMAAGTLVPFMSQVALPGDTWDIDLMCEVLTHPTIGPLFGSYKVQLDLFQCPIRLYQAQLHNNKLKIGLNMASIKLPQLALSATNPNLATTLDLDNAQINPSCILKYLGISGVGINHDDHINVKRNFNAVPYLAYTDIYKNYYANKQEEIGAFIHTPQPATISTVTSIDAGGETINHGDNGTIVAITTGEYLTITYSGTVPLLEQIMFHFPDGNAISAQQFVTDWVHDPTTFTFSSTVPITPYTAISFWEYSTATDSFNTAPEVVTFPLSDIDEMREYILANVGLTTPVIINDANLSPYKEVLGQGPGGRNNMLSTQEGLMLKTYQSDLFNNWLQTEWIDGVGGINEITSVSTTGDSFTMDALVMAKKVWEMLNAIGLSDGTYKSWINVVYDTEAFFGIETPVYLGGLIRELVFQEVISNSESPSGQPLGTIAGRGIMSNKRKGGSVICKPKEPSYIIGIVSLTPRLDYSQGNKWDTHLQTMDDLHKPHLDQIGFQELDTEQMAWWQTKKNALGEWITISAGKQTAWLNYQTEVNRCYGNFAIKDNEMFMTLNRRYEYTDTGTMVDLTTYIDPSKFNNIFAQTSRDAQNFWVQIGVKTTCRRKMSARVMPNL